MGGERLAGESRDNNFLYRSMTLVMAATLLSRVLGFGREIAIAYRFGATIETDAYLVAILLPTILFYAFSDALRNTFITVFASFKKDESAPFFVNTLVLYASAALLAVVFLGVIFAPQVVFLLAPGFKGESFELTVKLTRILVPGIFFMGLAGVATGFLHSHHRFLIPALVMSPQPYHHRQCLFLGRNYRFRAGAEPSQWLRSFLSDFRVCRVPFFSARLLSSSRSAKDLYPASGHPSFQRGAGN